MDSEKTSQDAIVTSVSELSEYYVHKSEDNQDLKTGIEWERFAVTTDSLDVVTYGGENGYQAVMRFLHEKKGWHIEDGEDDFIYSLLRGTSRITVEGDGRPEISAAPFPSLHIVAREIEQHKNEIDHFSDLAHISWLPLGFHPFAGPKEIPVIPKKRYQLFTKIFPNHNDWIEVYMRCLSGTHLNFGYTGEENLLRKLRVLYVLSPVVAALFSTSVFENSQKSSLQNVRRHKLLADGPGQEGMMPRTLCPDLTLAELLDWYAKQPVIYFPHSPGTIVPKGFTFHDWMEKGADGVFPRFCDFDQHVKTRWTDVRLRPSYLEYRVFDTLPYALLMSSAAFVKGLIFDRRGWKAVEEITKGWTQEDVITAHTDLCDTGIRTEIHGKSFLDIAKELVPVASENLQGFDRQNEQGEDERVFLSPLNRLLEKDMSVADDLLDFTGGDHKKIIPWTKKFQ